MTLGEWQTQKQPKLEDSYKKYTMLLRVGFFYMGFRFLGELLERNGNVLWFIYPYNKEFRDDLIVFSDETRESLLWQKNIYDLSTWQNPAIENLIRDTFKESNIFFSDDLTGTDFKEAIDFTIRK